MTNSTDVPFKPLVATAAYYASYIILGATMALLGPSLPWLAENTASRLDQISWIFAASSFGYMTGSLLGGRIYDRLPGHRIQALALLLISVGAAIVPVIPSLWVLVGIVFILGNLQGALDTGCNTLLNWIFQDKVGPFMNALHFFFGAGAFLAPIVFAKVVQADVPIQWAYWSFSLLALPVAAWFWLLPSPPIRKVERTSTSSRVVTGLFALVVLFYVFHVGLELGFGNWIYTYSIGIQLTDEASAAYLTSAFWGAFTLSRLLGVAISTRLRPQVILLADLSGCLFAFGILILWPDSPTALWGGTILMGLSIASVFATGMAFTEKHLKLTGAMTGWMLVGGGIGGMVSPWLIGQLFDRVGARITMPVLLVNNILALLILGVMIVAFRRVKKTG